MGLGSAKPPGFRGWRATIDVEDLVGLSGSRVAV